MTSQTSYSLIKTLKQTPKFHYFAVFLCLMSWKFKQVYDGFFWWCFCFCLLLNYASCPIARTNLPCVPTHPALPYLHSFIHSPLPQQVNFGVFLLIRHRLSQSKLLANRSQYLCCECEWDLETEQPIDGSIYRPTHYYRVGWALMLLLKGFIAHTVDYCVS